MRRLVACAVVVSLYGLLPAFGAAGLELGNDPQGIAWMREAPPAACELATRGGPSQDKDFCSALAHCGSYSISCSYSGAGSCQGVDQNCAAGERGYMRCGSTTTYCNACPEPEPANPCPIYPIQGCTYFWVPQEYCCHTTDPGCSSICY